MRVLYCTEGPQHIVQIALYGLGFIASQQCCVCVGRQSESTVVMKQRCRRISMTGSSMCSDSRTTLSGRDCRMLILQVSILLHLIAFGLPKGIHIYFVPASTPSSCCGRQCKPKISVVQ